MQDLRVESLKNKLVVLLNVTFPFHTMCWPSFDFDSGPITLCNQIALQIFAFFPRYICVVSITVVSSMLHQLSMLTILQVMERDPKTHISHMNFPFILYSNIWKWKKPNHHHHHHHHIHPYGININAAETWDQWVSERRATPATKMCYNVSQHKFRVTMFPISFGWTKCWSCLYHNLINNKWTGNSTKENATAEFEGN